METENNQFDKHIRQALEGIEDAPHQSDWDVFEQKLTNAEDGLNDTMFDGLIGTPIVGMFLKKN